MNTVAAYINKVLDNYDNDDVLATVKDTIAEWVLLFNI